MAVASVSVDLNPAIEIGGHDQVYRPSEDSHLLLAAIDLDGASTFLDVGTGSGLIALHAALRCDTVATDISPWAVELCKRNADHNGIHVEVVRTDLFAALRGRWDVIAFNPPYLPDSKGEGWIDLAWSGGPGGNEAILRFLERAIEYLSPEGRIYLLLSSHNGKALRRAREFYRVKPLRHRSLFFEEITAYELRPRDIPSSHNL